MQPTTARHAIIFGHTSGLGLAVAKQLGRQGFEIIGIGRSKADIPDLAITEIHADLSKADEVKRVIREIREKHSSFDVLVYTAGALTAHDMDKLDYADMEYLYRVNVFAPMSIESALLDLVEINGADVVNLTSSSIYEFYPKFAEYSTSKAAFAKFTSDLQRRLKDSSARVIDLSPSGFTSNMYATMRGELIQRDESKQIQVDDLAALVCYILALPKRMEITKINVNRK
jgi:3-oxoacyl-[acyl-carrier protein] reductase